MMISMSQEQLGAHIGITFQQIQKYERGTNRVGAGRLQAIARVLKVSVSFFFEGAPGGTTSEQPVSGFEERGYAEEAFVLDFLSSTEGLRLNRAFVLIRDPILRRRIVDLVRALASTEGNNADVIGRLQFGADGI